MNTEEQLDAEEIEERGEIGKAKTTGIDINIILITLQKISGSVFLLDFLANYPRYKFFLFLLWVVFAAAIYSISFAKDEKNKKIPSQTIFLLQCCAVWILLIAFSFLFIMK